ncbi:retropepsin-like aspartic protease [cf. Phormidesmis sp. LEGE 11477]|uniref:retropepsin-like aspartic protease family protein n=1 Tax=cf. Phormidesmis sp. LEGE 11477 TaxID=1828680 RepID=UPI00188271DD|nr:retropepsin-like domain-containing protein [cf. Phormidesmis sp. LEGE 11477]
MAEEAKQANAQLDLPDGQPSDSGQSAAEEVVAAEATAGADSIQSSLVAYQAGLDLASSANALSQSAISPDDWSLVLSRWQRAADQLQQVATESEKYSSAQQKIADYTRNATQAQGKIEQLKTEVYVPLPTRPAAPAERIAPQSDHIAGHTTVPIVRRLHGTPVVQVTFNHGRTYDMILDTGASRTLITRQMANDLGIEPTEQMVAATASAAAVTFDIGQVRTITMGALTLNNARVSIGDAIDIGLLGNDFFLGYDVIIRSRENVVEFVKS